MGTFLYEPPLPARSHPEPHLFFGLDLGRRRDPAALVLLERLSIPLGRTDPVTYQPLAELRLILRAAVRYPLGLPYLTLVSRVSSAVASAASRPAVGLSRPFAREPRWPVQTGHPARPHRTLVVDATGVGAPVVELLRRAPLEATLMPVTITSGAHTAPDPHGGWLIPRRDLLTRLRITFESGLLRIPRSLPLARDILNELVHLSDTPSSRHDDLAFALALATWPALPADSLPNCGLLC